MSESWALEMLKQYEKYYTEATKNLDVRFPSPQNMFPIVLILVQTFYEESKNNTI